jgi:hypothetical protein
MTSLMGHSQILKPWSLKLVFKDFDFRPIWPARLFGLA